MKLAFISGIAGIVFSGLASSAHSQQIHGRDHAIPQDTRQVVHFPEVLRIHTLANMRDHLLALQQIDEALADQDFDEVARISESRLGSSSLEAHGAHQLAPYMPKGMQDFGTAMHTAASRLAIAAIDAGATGDHRPTLAALGQVMKQCVACHAAYRVQ
jgi:cytochrome c556